MICLYIFAAMCAFTLLMGWALGRCSNTRDDPGSKETGQEDEQFLSRHGVSDPERIEKAKVWFGDRLVGEMPTRRAERPPLLMCSGGEMVAVTHVDAYMAEAAHDLQAAINAALQTSSEPKSSAKAYSNSSTQVSRSTNVQE